jgi:lipopolysaccharide export LptBFGC system permease protein LptF
MNEPQQGNAEIPGLRGIIDFVSRGVFGIAAVVLMLIALALSIYSAALIVNALRGPWGEAGTALLESIGYVVIAVAVFDVAKYFMEEEVIRGREMRLPSEARRSLTKFISTIAIAVFIEGLVIVFRQSGQDVALILYPSAILVTGVAIIVGLGVYQRLSADVEAQVEARDKVAEKNGAGKKK